MRSKFFPNYFPESYSQKKGDRSRPWYTPGNKREKPVGHVTQCRIGSTHYDVIHIITS